MECNVLAWPTGAIGGSVSCLTCRYAKKEDWTTNPVIRGQLALPGHSPLTNACNGDLVNYFFFFLFLFSAGITKAASKLSLRQEVMQQEAPPAIKPAVTMTFSTPSYPSNGQIHSQYHGYYVKADVKIPPPEEPVGVEDDLHPSSLARLPPPAKQIREPALKSLPAHSPSQVPPKGGTKVSEPPKPKRQESTKPKSLAETKKSSVEIAPEIVEESVS